MKAKLFDTGTEFEIALICEKLVNEKRFFLILNIIENDVCTATVTTGGDDLYETMAVGLKAAEQYVLEPDEVQLRLPECGHFTLKRHPIVK